MKDKMKLQWLKVVFIVLLPILFTACQSGKENDPEIGFTIPVDYYILPNGLKVILSQDKTAPTVMVAIYYNIGFRIEPKNRTGFAHLFEHMMFQGTKNMPKGEFMKIIEGNGGEFNGSTDYDYTNYYEIIPSHMLKPILWVEADRMSSLDITEENLNNQREVVKNEVNDKVLNAPYGGFPWLDMPQYANENWHNAHNFFGDLEDLDSAKIEDVTSFFKAYYAPNNATLTVIGDFEIDNAKKWIEEYFGVIPKANLRPIADTSEPEQKEEKRFVKEDKLANKPAISIAYKMPERNTSQYYAMGLIDQLLLQGDDSKLNNLLVQEKEYTDEVSGGINYSGNMFNYSGPALWISKLIYDSEVSTDSIISQFDNAIASLDNITQEELDLAMIKLRSNLYDIIADKEGRADLLSCFALFDDDPTRINKIEGEFKKITPDMIRKTLKQYLSKTNRTILIIDPKAEGI